MSVKKYPIQAVLDSSVFAMGLGEVFGAGCVGMYGAGCVGMVFGAYCIGMLDASCLGKVFGAGCFGRVCPTYNGMVNDRHSITKTEILIVMDEC